MVGNETYMARSLPIAHFRSTMKTFGLRDYSVSALIHGYGFWDLMRQRQNSEIVQIRVLGSPATCIRGPQAAKYFYEEAALERSSALPDPLVSVLFGDGAVHTLDGAEHAHRKGMFNDILTAEAFHQVAENVAELWDAHSQDWSGTFDIVEESSRILFRAGCSWLGLSCPEADVSDRASDMLGTVDGFGSIGRRQLRARSCRRRTESWISDSVHRSRENSEISTPLDIIASHRNERGELLTEETATVEVLNLIRPLVAVSWLIGGATIALEDSAHLRDELIRDSSGAWEFAQEVRRIHPFVPYLAARATADLVWLDAQIPKGSLLVIDVWGTHHDEQTWDNPYSFDPTRFQRTPVTAYNLIAQGGGNRHTGHRCPGEDLTLNILANLASRLAAMRLDVVDSRPGKRRMPPAPELLVKSASHEDLVGGGIL